MVEERLRKKGVVIEIKKLKTREDEEEEKPENISVFIEHLLCARWVLDPALGLRACMYFSLPCSEVDLWHVVLSLVFGRTPRTTGRPPGWNYYGRSQGKRSHVGMAPKHTQCGA